MAIRLVKLFLKLLIICETLNLRFEVGEIISSPGELMLVTMQDFLGV